MVKVLYIIRHGETADPHPRRYKGSIDVPLSARGHEQAHAAGRYLFDVLGARLDAVYCSTLCRAADTARAIAAPQGLLPIARLTLRERHFGRWEGMTFDEIAAAYPDDFRNWASNPLHFSPLEGESTLEVHSRAMQAITEIHAHHEGQTVVIVAHGGINRVVLCHYLGAPLENIFRIGQDHACINAIEFHDGYPVVKLLNMRAML